jgi:hypothetical protein
VHGWVIAVAVVAVVVASSGAGRDPGVSRKNTPSPQMRGGAALLSGRPPFAPLTEGNPDAARIHSAPQPKTLTPSPPHGQYEVIYSVCILSLWSLPTPTQAGHRRCKEV